MKKLLDKAVLLFYKLAASGLVPARWFAPGLPSEDERVAMTGHLQIEIVSHCWQYSHLLVYQLSSLILHPPQDTRIVMLTAKGRDTDVAKGLALGANAYMTKPFSTRELVDKVHEMLGQESG